MTYFGLRSGGINARVSSTAQLLGVPSHFLELLLAIEDQRFFIHFGLDLLAVGRAIQSNVIKQGARQGASTIPQQLYSIRMTRKGRLYRRDFQGKLLQICFGIRVSATTSKTKILSEYLNGVYWGTDVWGLTQACERYLNKKKELLKIEESFFLVERLACPNRFSKARLQVILKRSLVTEILQAHDVTAENILIFYEELIARSI